MPADSADIPVAACLPYGNDVLSFSQDGLLGGKVLIAFAPSSTHVPSISGRVYSDLRDDGNEDAGDPGLGGRIVYLDSNGQFDSGDWSTTTAADGSYAFYYLPPATYTVCEVVPTGWVQTSGTDGGATLTNTASQYGMLSLVGASLNSSSAASLEVGLTCSAWFFGPTQFVASLTTATVSGNRVSISLFAQSEPGFGIENTQTTITTIDLPQPGQYSISATLTWIVNGVPAQTPLDTATGVLSAAPGSRIATVEDGETVAAVDFGNHDLVPPTVVSIVPTGNSLTNAASLAFAVTFSKPVVSVAASDFALALSGTAGTISSVAGSGANYVVSVTGVSGNGTLGLNLVDNDSIEDPSGNPLGGPGIGNGNFTGEAYTIDTEPPTILSVAPNPSIVTDGNAGSDTFSLTAAFSEAMNTAIAPTISFPTSGKDPTATPATLTLDQAWWRDDMTYVAIYDMTDRNEKIPDIDVEVAGGQDLAGNVQAPALFEGDFSVDTHNPLVTGVTVNHAVLVDANVGAGQFAISVAFDQPMDASPAPTISFSPERQQHAYVHRRELEREYLYGRLQRRGRQPDGGEHRH